MSQGVFNWPDQVSGTTLHPRPFETLVDGSPPTSPIVSAEMVFEKDGETTLTVPLTVTSTSSWTITSSTVSAATMILDPGYHFHDIKTTDSNGSVEKYVAGSMKILPSPPQPDV